MGRLRVRMSTIEPETLLDHARFLRSLTRSLVADPQTANDLSQETWLQALGRPPVHAANLRGWLVRVTRRLADGERRRTASRAGRERDRAREEALPSAAEIVARREVLQRVTDAVLALEEPYHTTVLMRFYEGLEAREIAEQTGVPLATVRSRLQRGLQRLRERLDAEYGGDRQAWCLGLVSLLASRRLIEASAAGGGSLGLITGGMIMGTMVKIGAAVAALCVVGFLLSKAIPLEGLEAPVEGLVGAESGPSDAVEVDKAATSPAAGRHAIEQQQTTAVETVRGSLEVYVTWKRNGLPAADLELAFLLWAHPTGERKRRGRTDSAGKFLLVGLLPGSVVAESSFGAGVSIEVLAGETQRVDLEIPEGFTARGRVVDREGHGVAGARLWLSTYFNYHNGFIVGETRADGHFEVSEIPETRYLGALADGFAPSHLHLLRDSQVEGAASRDMELELVLNGAGGALQVLIVNEVGEPVPDVFVRAEGRINPAELGNGRLLRNLPTVDAWSDELGRLELRGLAPGTARLKALAPGMAPWSGTAKVIAGGIELLRIELAPECIVFGVVRKAGDEPAVGAQVALVGDYDPLLPMTFVDESGHYELRGLPAGKVQLEAWKRELGSVRTSLVLTPGEAVRWDARLDAGRVIVGRVTDDRGDPLEGWIVNASLGIHDRWRGQARSDDEGRFQLLDCKPGTLILKLYRKMHGERVPTLVREVRQNDDGEVLFVVGPGDLCDCSLEARFLSAGGEPVAGAGFTVRKIGASSGRGFQSDVEGRCKVDGLNSGTYRLRISPREGPPFAVGEYELTVAEQRDLGEIRLPPPGRLRLSVAGEHAPGGRPYRKFIIDQLDPSGDVVIPGMRFVDPDEIGAAIELYPGEYRVKAFAEDGFANERVAVEIEAGGAETTLEFQPRAGRSCYVGVSIPEGDDLPARVTLVLRDDQGIELVRVPLTAHRNRQYRIFADLAEGRYSLEAEAPDGRRLRHPFHVTHQSADLDVELRRGLEVIVPLR